MGATTRDFLHVSSFLLDKNNLMRQLPRNRYALQSFLTTDLFRKFSMIRQIIESDGLFSFKSVENGIKVDNEMCVRVVSSQHVR